MPKTVDAVFFRHAVSDILFFFFAGDFAGILHGSALLKTSPSGGKECGPRIVLFDVLQGRVGPKGLNKKFTEIVNNLGML
jgi:hypothetical protein